MGRVLVSCVSGASGIPEIRPCFGAKAGDRIVSVVSEVVFNTDLTQSFGEFIPTDNFIAWLGVPAPAANQAFIIMLERPEA